MSQKTVESYVEALKGGAVFPPIEVQKIRSDEVSTICLDGWHRLEACREYNKLEGVTPIKEIEVTFWKDETLDKEEHLEELRIESTRLNLIHGDRLAPSDLQFQALRIVKDRTIERLNGVVTELAELFGYSIQYMSELIGAEVRARRMSRDAEIYRISMLGWTQQEIGKLFGLDFRTVSVISKKFATEVIGIQQQFYKKHKPISEIAKFYNLDDITTWAIVLQGKDDVERLSLFGTADYQDDAPRLYNVWNFTQCDPRLGKEHPGRIPGQILLSLLYYYTKEGDLVVDPMAGGGSTNDACLVMGRKCRAYDIQPTRKEILKHDITSGFPKETKGCDFIFLDPPYWNLQMGEYTEESISEGSLEEWLTYMQQLTKDCYETVKVNGHVALLVEAMVDERGTKEFYDLPYMCMKFFEETCFKEVHRISAPVTTQVKSHHDVEYAKKKEIILDVNRDLIIYRRQ